MEHTNEGIRVGPSAHGLGVFSLRFFDANELLGPVEGEIMEDPQYSSDYCIDLGELSLEPSPPFRYLNHSCQPNCALVEYDDVDDHGATGSSSVWLKILHEIAPGEQMTIDYAWPAETAVPCHCGSAICRGWIVAPEAIARVAPRPQDGSAVN
jgi:uncharacterized protein